MFKNDEIEGSDCIIFSDSSVRYNKNIGSSNILYEGSISKGKYNDWGKLYHENGKLMYEGLFKNDKMHSVENKANIYYDNGKVEYEGKISDGLYSGYGIIYNRNGKAKMKGTFVEGRLNGNCCTVYFPNGMIQYQGRMKLGRYYGFGRFYYGKSGKIQSIGEHNFELFENSNFRFEFWANGQSKNMGTYNSANELIIGDSVSRIFSKRGLLEYREGLNLRKTLSQEIVNEELMLLKGNNQNNS